MNYLPTSHLPLAYHNSRTRPLWLPRLRRRSPGRLCDRSSSRTQLWLARAQSEGRARGPQREEIHLSRRKFTHPLRLVPYPFFSLSKLLIDGMIGVEYRSPKRMRVVMSSVCRQLRPRPRMGNIGSLQERRSGSLMERMFQYLPSIFE